MTETKPKQRKPKLELREPAKPLAPPESRQLAADHPVMEIFRQAQQPPTTHHPPPTDQPPPTMRPVAPERDFVRVPNSVVRDAIPAGLFKGESKKTYDALYQRTRGGIVPRRNVRATLSRTHNPNNPQCYTDPVKMVADAATTRTIESFTTVSAAAEAHL